MHLMLRRHLLWHPLSITIFNFLIYIFNSNFIFILFLAFYIDYGNLPIILTIRLNGSVVTNSDLDFFCLQVIT
jgi:hypothetical protein